MDRDETSSSPTSPGGEEKPRKSWLATLDGDAGAQSGAAVSPTSEDGTSPAPPPPDEDDPFHEVEVGVERIREEARQAARADAASGVPAQDAEGPTRSEVQLRDRCAAFFQRWRSRQRRRLHREISDTEERISDKLGRAALGIDRFERLTNELFRIKARLQVRRREVSQELSVEGQERARGLPTPLYVSALVFLGAVEFFANAPVFHALLPRDPLSERQIQLLTEMTQGWMAGIERAVAHIAFRPEAALLAAGVITFLCVLCHFFGHTLRDLVMQGESKERRYTVHSRSVRENVVPLVLCAAGLILTLGVLFEARDTLGVVGEERYNQDMAEVAELRREADWLRSEGELLEANELTDQADDMEEAAVELQEYSASMARMNFPVLLLNLTLVLCAIAAAYFHRRDSRAEHFNETPFEEERRGFVNDAERCAEEVSGLLADVVKDIRGLKTLTMQDTADDWRSVTHELESVMDTYRSENARARQLDAGAIASFREPIRLEVELDGHQGMDLTIRDPADYERERAELASRFQELRGRFNEESTSAW